MLVVLSRRFSCASRQRDKRSDSPCAAAHAFRWRRSYVADPGITIAVPFRILSNSCSLGLFLTLSWLILLFACCTYLNTRRLSFGRVSSGGSRNQLVLEQMLFYT